MEQKIYKIGRIGFIHRELTWAQDKKLTGMIVKLSGKAGGDQITLKHLPNILLKYDLMGEFWGIVLQRKINLWYFLELPRRFLRIFSLKRSFKFVDLGGISNSGLGEMFTDFFSLNKAFMKKLSTYGNALGLIARMMIAEEESKRKPSTSKSKPNPSKSPVKKKVSSSTPAEAT
jgi:hypothetical protein